MLPRQLATFASAVLTLSTLGACQVTIVDGDGDECGEGSNCLPEGCPATQPAEGDSCEQDGLTCTYSEGADGCSESFRCEPVYPEAGAPSAFVSLGSEGCEQCLAEPTCAPTEIQADSCANVDATQYDCHSVSACGSTIYCLIPVCDLAPACDDGDEQVNECQPDVGCYTVSTCDTAITCIDISLPQHGCPAVEPESGDPCAAPGQFCDYPDGANCFMSYYCEQNGTISWSGGGCEGNPSDGA